MSSVFHPSTVYSSRCPTQRCLHSQEIIGLDRALSLSSRGFHVFTGGRMSLDCYHERNLSNSSEFGANLWMERHPPSRQTPVVQGSSKLSLYHLILVITLSTKVCGRVGHCRICLRHHRRARNQGYESSHNNRHCPSCCLTPRKQKEIFAYPMDLPSRWNRLRTGPKTGKYSNSHHPYHSY